MSQINLNLVIVGDSSVGKTSLVYRYTEGKFLEDYTSTIGVEFRIKKFEYQGFQINLKIWDTTGQERFHSITKSFFNNTDGILFVYDITNYSSFEGLKIWMKDSEEFKNKSSQKLLLGNKCDLEDERKVKQEDVEKFCKEKNIGYFETSAKENINLNEAFYKIVELILKDKNKEEIINLYGTKKDNIDINLKKSKKKRNEANVRCC